MNNKITQTYRRKIVDIANVMFDEYSPEIKYDDISISSIKEDDKSWQVRKNGICPDHLDNVKGSIYLNGGLTEEPIVVIEAEHEMYLRASGFHRVESYRMLRNEHGRKPWAKIPAIVIKFSDEFLKLDDELLDVKITNFAQKINNNSTPKKLTSKDDMGMHFLKMYSKDKFHLYPDIFSNSSSGNWQFCEEALKAKIYKDILELFPHIQLPGKTKGKWFKDLLITICKSEDVDKPNTLKEHYMRYGRGSGNNYHPHCERAYPSIGKNKDITFDEENRVLYLKCGTSSYSYLKTLAVNIVSDNFDYNNIILCLYFNESNLENKVIEKRKQAIIKKITKLNSVLCKRKVKEVLFLSTDRNNPSHDIVKL